LFSLAFSGCATTGTFPTSASAPSYAKTQHLYKGIDLLADKLIASMGQHTVGKLAVADFKGPEDITTALGEYISDKLSIRLYSSGAFQDFMERKELKQILTSRKVEHGGYFDQNTVKKFGKMIGVDSMVIGAIKDMGTFVDVTAKIVNSETGRLQGIADVSLKKDATVTELINRIRAATLTIAVDPAVSGTVIAGGRHARLRNGTCTITGIPYGECQVIIHPDGHDTVRRGIPIRSQAETFAIRLDYVVSFQVNPPDASLSVDGKKVQLNTEGFAEVTDLRAGEHSFRIQSKGYEARAERFDPAGRQLIMLNLITNDPFYATKTGFSRRSRRFQEIRIFRSNCGLIKAVISWVILSVSIFERRKTATSIWLILQATGKFV
jgi:Curli production assembly/transport component CsgG.